MSSHWTFILTRRVALIAWAVAFSGASLAAAEPTVADAAHFRDHVAPFIQQHCVACHGPDKQKGKFRLDNLPADFGKAAVASQWIEVMDRINLGEMPPEDRPQPSIEASRGVTTWVAAELRHAQRRASGAGGRVLLRRLNRTEYANTIRDLLHIQFMPGEGPLALLPPDGTAEGFDKTSTALMTDPSLLDKYFEVAREIAQRAIVDGPPPFPTQVMRLEMEDIARNNAIRYLCSKPGFICRETDVVLLEGGTRSFGVMKYPGTRQEIPVKGLYRLRVRASAAPGADGEPVVMRVTQNHPDDSMKLLIETQVTAPPQSPQIFEVIVPRDPQGGEYQVSIVGGTGFTKYNRRAGDLDKAIREAGKAKEFAKVLRLSGRMKAEGLERGRPNPDAVDREQLPRLYVDWLEVQGPLYDQWPPKSHETLLFKGDSAANDRGYAREIFQRLISRAYRRPATDDQVAPIVKLVEQEMANGAPFNDAIRVGVMAVLTSPRFLYLHEPAAASKRRLDDYEIASRLSYFLWSSMPDQELFDLAGRGRLRDPAVMLSQVDRMLADDKAEALVNGFGAQWLRTSEFRNFRPDERLYKGYDDKLGQLMVDQTLAFFREILLGDRSALSFIDSDWTMLNERLANYYDIPGVVGEHFRPVKLPADRQRGGLLGQAGVAMYGSDGNRTTPVRRGVYVREVLFNDPPDPPPPNVGEIEPNIKGEKLTVRDRLLQHQQIESCAACHRTIDPYGLALENFNVIGQWRDFQDGEDFRPGRSPAIDVSGALPNGQRFETFGEFKSLLMRQQDRFAGALTERMLVYALGRPLTPGDRPLVDDLTQRMASQGYTLRSLIKGVVSSEAFLSK